MTPTRPPAKRDNKVLLWRWGLVLIGVWLFYTTLSYFTLSESNRPDLPKYYTYIPFAVFYGQYFLWLCAFVGAFGAAIYLVHLYQKRQEAMEKELENERRADSQVGPSRKTRRILQAIFFIGVMPILLSFLAYMLVVYLTQFDTDGPVVQILFTVMAVGLTYFFSFLVGMGLTEVGLRKRESDESLVVFGRSFGQVVSRILVFIGNAVVLGALIFLTRSCDR